MVSSFGRGFDSLQVHSAPDMKTGRFLIVECRNEENLCSHNGA